MTSVHKVVSKVSLHVNSNTVAIFIFKLTHNYHIQLSTFDYERPKKIHESFQNIDPSNGKCKSTFQIITNKQKQPRVHTNIDINNKR